MMKRHFTSFIIHSTVLNTYLVKIFLAYLALQTLTNLKWNHSIVALFLSLNLRKLALAVQENYSFFVVVEINTNFCLKYLEDNLRSMRPTLSKRFNQSLFYRVPNAFIWHLLVHSSFTLRWCQMFLKLLDFVCF